MSKSEYFMGRVLLAEFLKLNPKYESELKCKDVYANAKLTVVIIK